MDKKEKTEYKCPLTLYYMENPVLASDGHIYERDAIIKWYNQDVKHLSPMNRKVLDGNFVEQTELKNEINQYLNNNNIEREEKDIVFNIEVMYISCPNCHQKLKIINKEHKFYRCGNPSCKQIISLVNSRRISENLQNLRNILENRSPYVIQNHTTITEFTIETRRRGRNYDFCSIM
jgi:hypothetical protein